MLPWWMILTVISLITAAFGSAGPVHGAAATAQVFIEMFTAVSGLLLLGRVLGKARPFRPTEGPGSDSCGWRIARSAVGSAIEG